MLDCGRESICVPSFIQLRVEICPNLDTTQIRQKPHEPSFEESQEARLRLILSNYVRYYNHDRTHLALAKDAPHGRLVERNESIVATSTLGGLHHRYVRIRI